MQWADARMMPSMMRTLFIIKLDYGKYLVVSTYGKFYTLLLWEPYCFVEIIHMYVYA